jgi:CRISPR-associated protein Cas2
VSVLYVVVVYDVAVERLDKVRNVLKQYLNWVQNSAFEGELTTGTLEELKLKLGDIVDEDKDSLLFYSVPNPKWLNKDILGVEKSVPSTVV